MLAMIASRCDLQVMRNTDVPLEFILSSRNGVPVDLTNDAVHVTLFAFGTDPQIPLHILAATIIDAVPGTARVLLSKGLTNQSYTYEVRRTVGSGLDTGNEYVYIVGQITVT